MTERTEALTQAAAPAVPLDGSYVDWPAILAGAVVASAIAFVFAGFGVALGMSFISPYEGEGFATAAIIAAALWMLWTTISSFMAGGYLTGRLRRRVDSASADEVDTRDGSHGLIVWGVGVIIGAMMLSTAVSTTAKVAETTVSAAAEVTGTIGDAASEAVPVDYIADAIFRNDGTSPPESAIAIREEAQTIVMAVLRTGEMPDMDREYLYTVVAKQTGLDETESKRRVDKAIATAQSARDDALQAAETAEKTARDIAESARIYSILSAFALAAALLIAAAGAYWAAGLGGRHRDEGRVFDHFGRWD